MDSLEKKVGYLKGLMDGAKLDPKSENGKLLCAMFDVMNELSDRVRSMDEMLDELNDYVESIDDDLADLEGDFPDDFDDEDFDDEDFDDEVFDDEDMDFDKEDNDGPLRIVRGRRNARADESKAQTMALSGCLCPECGKMFFVAADSPDGAEYVCPHCGKTVLPKPLTPENAPVAKPAQPK